MVAMLPTEWLGWSVVSSTLPNQKFWRHAGEPQSIGDPHSTCDPQVTKLMGGGSSTIGAGGPPGGRGIGATGGASRYCGKGVGAMGSGGASTDTRLSVLAGDVATGNSAYAALTPAGDGLAAAAAATAAGSG
jgi:hypothetical protein